MDTEFTARFSQSYQTKMKILATLNDLCERGPYSQISVGRITEAAGISRSSFYHHFEDKDSAVQWLTRSFYERGLDQTGRSLNWFEGHMVTTRLFSNFVPLFISAANNTDYSSPQPFYIRHRQETLRETITDHHHLELTDLLNFQIEALPYAEKVLANKYLEGKFSLSIKKYCNYMVSLVPKELFEVLNEPIEPSTFHDNFN